jgi:hypothetical protein
VSEWEIIKRMECDENEKAEKRRRVDEEMGMKQKRKRMNGKMRRGKKVMVMGFPDGYPPSFPVRPVLIKQGL